MSTPTPDIKELIEELKELEKKTTKGEWARVFDEITEEQIIEPTGYSGYGKGMANVYNDGDLICALRNSFPAIAAHIAEQERLLEVATEALQVGKNNLHIFEAENNERAIAVCTVCSEALAKLSPQSE